MSAVPNVNILLGKGFTKLSGPENYSTWKKEFKPVAVLNGVWGLYQGTDIILEKPNLQDFLPTAPKPKNADQQLLASAAAAEADKTTTAPLDYQYMIALYNVQITEWKDNEKSVQFALALLQTAVEPWVWLEEFETDPTTAWNTIRDKNEVDADTRLDRALTQIDKIRVQDFKTVRDYLVQFENIMQDIKDAKGSYVHSQLINNIIRGLTSRYNPFITYWSLAPQPDDAETKYQQFRTSLLKYTDNNKERWEQQDKARENKTKSNNSSSNHSKGNQNKQNRPTCTWCGYRGHIEDECRNKADGKPRATQTDANNANKSWLPEWT